MWASGKGPDPPAEAPGRGFPSLSHHRTLLTELAESLLGPPSQATFRTAGTVWGPQSCLSHLPRCGGDPRDTPPRSALQGASPPRLSAQSPVPFPPVCSHQGPGGAESALTGDLEEPAVLTSLLTMLVTSSKCFNLPGLEPSSKKPRLVSSGWGAKRTQRAGVGF